MVTVTVGRALARRRPARRRSRVTVRVTVLQLGRDSLAAAQ